MNRERLLERFLQYVTIDTMARDDTSQYPSSPGQLELGRLVVDQLRQIGVEDAAQDEHGIVMATVPATDPSLPVVAFNSHFDTSPETTAENVRPQVIENYQGGEIALPGDATKIITETNNPELQDLIGQTLITTDGTTLLGGDDKAGMAIMMELANQLMENTDGPRGPVRLLFTCDEEIGRGTMHVDVDKVNATVCYTFDGGQHDLIDVETFSADLAVVTIEGINIHPSIAKDKMVNAIRAAGDFVTRLPSDMSPEHTDERLGFLHPYVIEGGVDRTTLKVLLRDFETKNLQEQAKLLTQIGIDVENDFPGTRVNVDVRKQYRNMADGLAKEPRAVDYAVEAHRRLGREPRKTVIRGGTDGSQLTEKGLPTPNLSSGQHNPHSPLEFASLDEMLAACEVGLEIVKVWAEKA